jgi:hypothetical protein
MDVGSDAGSWVARGRNATTALLHTATQAPPVKAATASPVSATDTPGSAGTPVPLGASNGFSGRSAQDNQTGMAHMNAAEAILGEPLTMMNTVAKKRSARGRGATRGAIGRLKRPRMSHMR